MNENEEGRTENLLHVIGDFKKTIGPEDGRRYERAVQLLGSNITGMDPCEQSGDIGANVLYVFGDCHTEHECQIADRMLYECEGCGIEDCIESTLEDLEDELTEEEEEEEEEEW